MEYVIGANMSLVYSESDYAKTCLTVLLFCIQRGVCEDMFDGAAVSSNRS